MSLAPKETLKWARRLQSPNSVQEFISAHPYNTEAHGETLRSAEAALLAKTWHCLESTFVAAALLEHHGYPPLLLSLESADHLDHVLYLFQENNKWGSISRSRDLGLEGRPPLFASIKDLAMSYFDYYIDKTARLVSFQWAHLDEISADWRTSPRNVWQVESYLIDLKHHRLSGLQKRYNKIYHQVVKEQKKLPPPPRW